MAEQEVIELLKECGEALSCNEIAQKLIGKANAKNFQRAVKQLEKYGEIKAIKVDVKIARRIYGKNIKKGLKLFYVVNE